MHSLKGEIIRDIVEEGGAHHIFMDLFHPKRYTDAHAHTHTHTHTQPTSLFGPVLNEVSLKSMSENHDLRCTFNLPTAWKALNACKAKDDER